MVTVTDVHGCTGTDGASVTFLLPLSPVITGNTNICPTGSTTLTADDTNVYKFSPCEAAAFEYQWSNGATTQRLPLTPLYLYRYHNTATRWLSYPRHKLPLLCHCHHNRANPPTTPILLPLPQAPSAKQMPPLT